MSVSLEKGQKISLSKESAANGNTLKKLTVGLGWDEKPSQTSGEDYDLDASAFALDANGKVLSDEYFIFWGTKNKVMIDGKEMMQSPEGAIIHTGDNLTGAGSGDDETIIIDLSLLPTNVAKVVFAVTIYKGKERGQNFGQVDNSYIRALDDNGTELIKYELDMQAALETVVVFGEIALRGGEWVFSANSSAFPGGFDGLCKQYGVNVA